MKTPKHSLRKIVSYLNNPDEDGGFWLPNIQRPFVWNEEQTCRLFDSILREYPISTLLVWKTRSNIRCRRFIDNFWPEQRNHLADFYVPQNDRKKCLVLDGQQRLQSLFIGLKGSYEGRELFLNILSGEVGAPDDIKYKFAFLKPAEANFPWIKFKDLVFGDANSFTATQVIVNLADRELTEDEKVKIGRHIAIIFKAFHSDDGISYQELDSTENPQLYTEDDVVEVFIRANSGGTRLGKSDLLFALLTSTWDDANDQMEDLLDRLNRHGFAFTRDFVLKTCLTLLGHGARYEVEKFRKPGVREEIEQKWDEIANAISDVLDFVRGKTFIRCDKALPTYLVLIPLIHLRYKFRNAWQRARDMDQYLLRSSLAGAFGGTPDQLIDDLVREINQAQDFDLKEAFGIIRSQNRSLELTEDRLWTTGYGSEAVHLLFNLWYRDFNYTPAYSNNLPQVDHIFPQSLLRQVKTRNPATGRMNMMKYREAERNQLANCMLLTMQENGAGGKSDLPPEEWFVGERAEADYLQMHLIPSDKSLWKLERFEDFIAERKKLIAEKFNWLLVGEAAERRPAVDSSRIQKALAYLIDSGILLDEAPLYLTYKGKTFTGKAKRSGIELPDGFVAAPSAAAVRCYEQAGTVRPSENGWQVWKSADGRTLNALFADAADTVEDVPSGQDHT
ncbi:GmrSD restriction endonuclease domain-containing protein [Bradyrhizobium japonicum]|uniref:GmrSD restriction endonuclease domain-containing protein n=1 Tax=Bradyrhizobium japonicum TaxID=375 RepID=UPI0004121AD6|nr:DUF262 domain-containing protein [Bradyrhizobium japonicum]